MGWRRIQKNEARRRGAARTSAPPAWGYDYGVESEFDDSGIALDDCSEELPRRTPLSGLGDRFGR